MSFKRTEEYADPGSSIAAPHATGGMVIAALLFLWLVRKGFRGASVPGVGSVNLG